MQQVYNPYLPQNEYVPDGEPHVFNGRVYVYGSHDAIGATAYCPGHYVTWSAPVDNLRDWRYEGVIYRRNQDPSNPDDTKQLWAPDVTQGPDGRYYLYYCFNFYPEIGVAVSDSPAGPFEYYGHIKYPESLGGQELREFMPFDPAVLTDDDGRVYLYYGFCPAKRKAMCMPKFTEEELAAMPADQRQTLENLSKIKFGEDSMVVELEQDMVTMKYTPKPMIPSGLHEDGTDFEGHGFFEASSIRIVNTAAGKKYYFVYSSHQSAELCYAVSDKPDEGFKFGGVIVHNGDLGLDGRTMPVYTTGNNHGGLVQANGEWYIFYHKPTDGTEFSRQGCAEKVVIKEDGSIDQVEITSCGLNGGPLAGSGCYPATICCHMTSPTTRDWMDYGDPIYKQQTRETEEQCVNFITDVADGTIIGYKYFLFDGSVKNVVLEVRGNFRGTITLGANLKKAQNELCPGCKITNVPFAVESEQWKNLVIPADLGEGKKALYFLFEGEGSLDLKTVAFISVEGVNPPLR